MSPGYFFIGGPPKSGTTWLQRTLDLHPEIICSGEGHLHEFVVRPIHEMVSRYNEKLAAVAAAVYEGEAYCPPVSRREQIEITRTVMSILMSRRSKSGARLIGDKTPANAKIVEDLAVLFPGMKFIAMTRDPRDVAASRLGHARRTGHAQADAENSDFYLQVVQTAAVDWRLSAERVADFRGRAPGQALVVRYEDLLADPHAELRRILGFLGAAAADDQVSAIADGSRFEVFSRGRPAGVESRTSFYRKGVAGDWVNVLTQEAIDLVQGECGEHMARSGYDAVLSQAERCQA